MLPKSSEARWLALDVSKTTVGSLLQHYIQSDRYQILAVDSDALIPLSKTTVLENFVKVLPAHLMINFINLPLSQGVGIDCFKLWFKLSQGFIITLNLDDYVNAQQNIFQDLTRWLNELLRYMKIYRANLAPIILVLTKNNLLPLEIWELALLERLKNLITTDQLLNNFKDVLLVTNSIPTSLDTLTQLCQQPLSNSPLAFDNIFGAIHLYLAEKHTTKKDEGQLEYFCLLLNALYATKDCYDYNRIIKYYSVTALEKFKPGFFSGVHRFREYLKLLETLSMRYLKSLLLQLNLYKVFILIDDFPIAFDKDEHSTATIAEVIPLKRIIKAQVFEHHVSYPGQTAAYPPVLATSEEVKALALIQTPPQLNLSARHPFNLYDDAAL